MAEKPVSILINIISYKYDRLWNSFGISHRGSDTTDENARSISPKNFCRLNPCFCTELKGAKIAGKK